MRVVNVLLTGILTLATSACIAYSLFGVGLVVCTTPQATSFIGNTFSGWEDAVFPKEDMETLAQATRSFSIEGTPEEELYDTMYGVLAKNNAELLSLLGLDASNADSAANDTEANPKSGTSGSADASGAEASGTEATNTEAAPSESTNSTNTNSSSADALAHALRAEEVAAYLDQYSLPANALSHLQDCTPLFQTGRISTGVVAAFGLVGLIALGLLQGRRRAGGACIGGASLVFVLLIMLGAWALLSFDSLFTWMHTMLFAQGNWTFPSDSLLIQLFPEAFWAAMAGLWVLTSALCALVVLLLGKLLAHR